MKIAERSLSLFTWLILLLTALVLASCGGGGGGGGGTTPVSPVASSQKAITAYSIAGAVGTIDETNKKIFVALPPGTPVMGQIATFTTTGTGVTVAGITQVSGTTPNDFANPVTYTVTAADGSTVNYTVTVTVVAIGNVVINEIYGGGGMTGSPYNQDFIELYNSTTVPIDLSTWSLQYASATGVNWIVAKLTGTIQPGGYYLIATGSVGATGAALPTPDFTSGTLISSTSGKLILTTDQASRTGAGACPADTQIVDLVGYGLADCFWGPAAASSPTSSAYSIARSPAGHQTQNNSADFINITPPTPGVGGGTAIGVVINEIYGGGGNAGAAYNQDFVELYNSTAAPVDLSTWSLQYASATGTTWFVTNLTGTIQAGGYYLIAAGPAGSNGAALPTPNLASTQLLGTAGGKLILSKVQATLTGGCPSMDPNNEDVVGYGTSNCYMGPAPAPSFTDATYSITRSPVGQQTYDNSADFINVTPPTPGAP